MDLTICTKSRKNTFSKKMKKILKIRVLKKINNQIIPVPFSKKMQIREIKTDN